MSVPDDIAARSTRRERIATVESFDSIDQENEAERMRMARMLPRERLAEAAALKERVLGPGWAGRPMERVWSYEIVDWL